MTLDAVGRVGRPGERANLSSSRFSPPKSSCSTSRVYRTCVVHATPKRHLSIWIFLKRRPSSALFGAPCNYERKFSTCAIVLYSAVFAILDTPTCRPVSELHAHVFAARLRRHLVIVPLIGALRYTRVANVIVPGRLCFK